ncbi:DNA topoisomerase (ATP-hydrolyzing) subunit A [Quadrisphaera sp. INWT6]|uniref:DNA gyrase/topoisomerase IV subunit A n=1 Tax=Quadrisphaera sp. INWT6 TaxID=2596917 RepID=UPI0018924E96|nr:DNA topoisomerase IV subunit A [Quadrisphaera sp. INWT6]MBF5081042.1 DNA topoisomerase IV subunit A [Quadrisphaera sp. INWT6]
MARRSTSRPADQGPPPAERILDVDVDEEMRSSFLEYAYSVIYSRALPDARDGLKPVQRRILFQMGEMGLRPDRGHVKSARVVGDVMGRLHPHGDTAIYDALVRMAQDFSLRLPLVDGHGNFGSLDDGPAASRYTEARMALSATAMVDGLDEDVVDFVPTYDNAATQPSVLPSAIPNLLVNGASGIAVGMATNMPPHNLGEVVAAARHLIARPDATLDDLMRFVPGPDLPSGGRIVGLEGIRDAYATGRGTFRTRATARIEDITARRKGIVFTELPYTVGPEKVIEKVKDAVSAKKLLGIAAIDDFTDREHGLRLVVEVKTGFTPEAVLAQLYKLTPLEDSFGINNVCLVEGQPRTLGLRELLQVFIGHRLEVVRRRSTHRLAKRRERLHLVEGLLIAVLDIDEVIQVIRTSDDGAAARSRLVEVFDLSDVQAEHILELRLRRLTRFSRLELETEQAELLAAIAELEALLGDEALQREAVSDGLAEVARVHGTPRRTVLLEAGAAPATAAVPLQVADDPCWVLLSATGLLARTAGSELPSGGPRTAHDVLRSAVHSTARGDVGALTSRGRVLRVGVVETPSLPPTAGAPSLSGGAPLREFVTLEAGEEVVALVPLTQQPGDGEGAGLALATAQGVVKRVAAEPVGAKDSWEVIGLDPSDAVVGAAWLARGDEELVLTTSDAQLLRFSASLVRPQGRAARGMAGVRVSAGARVLSFAAVPADAADQAVVVTVAGAAGALPGSPGVTVKVAPFDEYPPKGRATGGVRCHRFLKDEGELALAWVGLGPARATSATGAPVELPAPTGRRDGSGVPLAGAVVAVDGTRGDLPDGLPEAVTGGHL